MRIAFPPAFDSNYNSIEIWFHIIQQEEFILEIKENLGSVKIVSILSL